MDDELKNNVLKTGTSIIGIVCKDGIVMAADRQVTAGNIAIQKNTKKVFPINSYLVGAWCGVSSDAQVLTKLVSAELRLKQLKSKQRPTVREGANLFASLSFRNIRQFTTIPSIVGTLVAGYNEDGTVELYSIEPAGGIYKVEDYDASFGSGMPYMLGYLERKWEKNISIQDGIEIAKEALKASTQRDTGSGYGLDIFTITKDGIKQVLEQEIVPDYKNRKATPQ